MKQQKSGTARPIAVMLLLTALAAALLAAGCIIPVERGKYVRGMNFILGVTQIRLVDEVPYQHLGKSYVIRPEEEGNVLAVARVTLNNHRSAGISIFIDESAIRMEDTENQRHIVLDPFERGLEVEQPLKDEGLYQPFIWGSTNIDQGYAITGWTVFEVPKGTKIARFVWEQGEYIVVRFVGPGS